MRLASGAHLELRLGCSSHRPRERLGEIQYTVPLSGASAPLTTPPAPKLQVMFDPPVKLKPERASREPAHKCQHLASPEPRFLQFEGFWALDPGNVLVIE